MDQKEKEKFIENLLTVLPYWHCVVDKNFKTFLKDKMSLESYYCLQTIRHGGALSMSELAERLRISRQQATQMVQRLYEYGFICRLQDDADRRSVKIQATDKAEAYIKEVYYRDSGFMESLEERIGPEDMAALSGAIETLLRVLPEIEKQAR